MIYQYYPWKAYADPRMPSNDMLADVAILYQPGFLYGRREVFSGRFPLWNPYSFAGSPFMANMQSALFSPFTLAGYLVPESKAPAVMAILRLLVAGLSMFWFLRLVQLSRPASALGAIAFMFSGFMTVSLQCAHASVVAWLPLMMGLVLRIRSSPSWGNVGLLALVSTAQIAGGHPETSVHVFLGVFALTLFLMRGPRAGGFTLRIAAGLGLSIAIAAVQVFPFLDYLGNCAAANYRLNMHPTGKMMPIRFALMILIPDLFGSPVEGNYLLGGWNYFEMSAWVGVAPLILLPCAFFASRSRPLMWFCLGLSVLSFPAIYSNPLASRFSHMQFSWLVIHDRFRLLFDFGLAALAAFGLDALSTPGRRRARWTLAGPVIAAILLTACGVVAWKGAHSRAVLRDESNPMMFRVVKLHSRGLSLLFIAYALSGSALAAAALASRRFRPAAVGGLFALELASLLPHAATYNTVVDAKRFYPETPAITRLKAQAGLHRVRGMPPNISSLFRIFDIVGHDSMTPERIEKLLDDRGTLGAGGTLALQYTRDINSPVLDLFNTRYVLANPGVGPPGPKWSVDYRGEDGWILRNSDALPRAFLVFRTVAEKKKEADAVDTLVKGEADLRTVALLPAGRPGLAGSEPPDADSTEIVEYRPSRVAIRTSAPVASCLVLLDTYFPGWRALVDGKRARIERADYAFRGVLLGPGRHQVEFIYNPLPFRIGLLVSCAVLVIAVIMAVQPRRERGR